MANYDVKQLNFTKGSDTYTITGETYESKSAASGGTDVSLVTTGEKYTWNNKLSSHQTIKQDGVTGATVNRYGACSTAAETAAKTVSITTGTFSLETGSRVTVKFANANTANSPTLNVNSKGAKNIFHRGSQITTGANKALLAGVCDFVYDGTQWHLVGNYYDSNTTYAFDGTYNASTNKAATVSTVTNAIGALDGSVTGTAGAGNTLTAFSQTDGKVTATFGAISITKSQVSDFPSTMTPASHTHGNIQNGGTLQTTDITIANGDKLVVTDASNSNKVARTSIAFDASTATQCLTKKGTWASFTNNAGTITKVQANGTDVSSSGTANIPAATTSAYGVTKLSTSTSSTSNALAATPSAVKSAYDQAVKGMTGASSSAAGAAGRVPAPGIGDQTKYLKGDGTWDIPEGSRVYVVDLDDVTNTSGSYTHTTAVSGVSSGFKCVLIECGNPEIFGAPVTVTTGEGMITLACDSVAGTSTVKVSLLMQGNADPLTSNEYSEISSRVGALNELTTTNKTSIVNAVNSLNENTIKYKYFQTSSGFTQNPELKYWMSSTYKSEFENRIPLVGYALADGFFDVAFRQDEEYFFIFIKNAVNNSAYAPWPAGGVYVYYLDKIN